MASIISNIADWIAEAINSLGAADVTFKVTPEQLGAQAEVLQSLIASLRTSFQSTDNCVQRSKFYWQGEAAEAHREQYDAATSEVEELLSTLESYVTRLNTIAGNYSQTESDLAGALSSLPEDVIE